MVLNAIRLAGLMAAISLTAGLAAAQATAPDARAQLIQELNDRASQELEGRSRGIAQITNRTDAEKRQQWDRATLLRLIGGLPDERGPLNARTLGEVQGDGFRVEKLIYDSLPKLHVTANLYLPANGSGPFPAILYTPGHYPPGKGEAWPLAGNLARNGIAVLAWDPIGQGERLQYLDPVSGKSRAGGPTAEHSEASLQVMPLGEQVSRYFIWDAMRGIDYLTSRSDIDAQRIGALGCSGGGTDTAYLAALDSRVKVAGVACFITSFNALLSTLGPQEAEQSIPDFISSGLGFPDWPEMFAPKPYAIISTTEDMFPFAGARQSEEEAKRFYSLFGAEEHLAWITGPGHHGHLRPVYPQIIGFFTRWLKGSDVPPTVTDLAPPPPNALLCTSTGQVASSLGGATIASIAREQAAKMLPTPQAIRTESALRAERARVQAAIRKLASVPENESMPEIRPSVTDQRTISGTPTRSYTLESVTFASVTGVNLPGFLAIPAARAAKHPAVLLLTSQPWDTVAQPGSTLDKLASSGNVVFAPAPLPTPPGKEEAKSPVLGEDYFLALRTMLVGETLPGLRIEDALRVLAWLASQPEVDAHRIAGYGDGAMGLVLLHAAVLDPRITSVQVEHTLFSYRSIVDDPLPKDIAGDEIPGVLLHYDVADLLLALSPRRVTMIDPVDAAGNPVSEADVRRAMNRVFASDSALHHAGRVRLQ